MKPRQHEPADDTPDDAEAASSPDNADSLTAAEATVRFRAGHRGNAARVKASIERRLEDRTGPDNPPSGRDDADRLVMIEGALWWNFERFCNLHGYLMTEFSDTEITHVHRPGTPPATGGP